MPGTHLAVSTPAIARRQFLKTTGAALLSPPAVAAARPNILLIVADDLGWSDLGCYSGEIETPNLDRLAQDGVRFTQFYNAARCCPSRASILTGLYPHQAGMGNMTAAKPRTDYPGYSGVLNQNNVTIAEALKSAGYSTWMAGKWHLGPPGPVSRGAWRSLPLWWRRWITASGASSRSCAKAAVWTTR